MRTKYIEREKKGLTAKEIETLVITDDDLVELSIFRDVYDEMVMKVDDRDATLDMFIKSCK